MIKPPAIFLDRDGTLIEDNGYLHYPSEVQFFPFTFEALRSLQNHFSLFIVTNQSGISKGITSETEVKAVNRHIIETLQSEGITILELYYCPHATEDRCICKKPQPYFLQLAAQQHGIDLSKSFIIGDHPSDVECGLNAGVTPLYLLTGHGHKHKAELPLNTKIFNNLSDASQFILTSI